MPAENRPGSVPEPYGATASGATASSGAAPGASAPEPAWRTGDAPRRVAQAALKDLPWEVGVAKPDPAIVVDGVTRTFGGLTAVSVDHLEVQRGGITGPTSPTPAPGPSTAGHWASSPRTRWPGWASSARSS